MWRGSGMDNQLLGGLIGLGLGIVNYFVIGQFVQRIEEHAGNERKPERERVTSILKAVQILDVILLPAVLYFAFGFIEDPILA